MRNKGFLSAVLIFSLIGFSSIVWYFSQLPDTQAMLPAPTEVVYNNLTEEEKHKQKKDWIEQMHRAAPDVNWREIDAQTRASRPQIINQYKKQALDSFANGKLVGQWLERGSENQSGRILMTTFDTATQKIYCTSQGGNVWRGSKNGTGWEVLNDKFNLGSTNYLHLYPIASGKRIFVSTSSKNCYYSDDEGFTWQSSTGLESIESWGNIRKTVSTGDSVNTLITLALEWDYVDWESVMSVYASKDKGESFSQIRLVKRSLVNGNSNLCDVWAPRYHDHSAFYLQGDSLFQLNTDSLTFEFIQTLPVQPTNRVLLTGSVFHGNTILYAYLDQDIYKSSDGGKNWVQKGNVGSNPFRNTSFYCKMKDTSTVYLGGVNCYVSTDNGSNWVEVNQWWEYYQDVENKLHADIPSVNEYIDVNGQPKLLIATDGGLYSSSSPFVVSNLSLYGHNVSQYYSVYTHQTDYNYVYAGSQDQGMQRASLDDEGILSFDQIISGDYGYIVSSDGGNSFWTVYPGFAHYYPDGKNGVGEARWNFDSLRGEYWMPPLEEHPTNSEKVYLAGGYLKKNNPGSFIMELTRSGSTISATELSYNFEQVNGEKISAFEISDQDPNYWYVLTNEGNFYYSTDGGQTFSVNNAINGPGDHYFFGATIHTSALDPQRVYIGGSGYSNPPVFVSNDHGQSFTQLSDSLPSTLVFDLIGTPDDSLLFAATEVGPYVLEQKKGYWELMLGTNGPDQRYWAAEYLPQTETVRFATHGRGIWDFKRTLPSLASVEQQAEPKLLVFPNPAAEIIQLEGITTPFQVACFSVNGQRVSVTPNGTTISVTHLPTGTYFLQVKTSEKVLTTRFVKE